MKGVNTMKKSRVYELRRPGGDTRYYTFVDIMARLGFKFRSDMNHHSLTQPIRYTIALTKRRAKQLKGFIIAYNESNTTDFELHRC